MSEISLDDFRPEKIEARNYSFNIESSLFQTLTKEQQILWREEIEQAHIAGSNWRLKENGKLDAEVAVIIDEIFNILPDVDKGLSCKDLFGAKILLKIE